MKTIAADDSRFPVLWRKLREADGLNFPLYGELNLSFYQECFEHEVEDVSFVVASKDDVPVLGVRLTVDEEDGDRRRFSCYGLPSLFLSDPRAPVRQRRHAMRAVQEQMASLLNLEDSWQFIHRDFLCDGRLSEFSRHLLALGASASPAFTQLIDLGASETQLHTKLSKSFRWNVNWGRKNLTLRVVEGASSAPADMTRFKTLHKEASGRQTRPEASWDRQFDMLRGNEAFAVFAEMDGEMVSAALFPVSQSYCFYGVSASDRTLFDKPMSHAVIWEALLHARNLGCRWFEMGEQVFPGQSKPGPSEKELGISTFKRRFGGDTHIRLLISLNSDMQ